MQRFSTNVFLEEGIPKVKRGKSENSSLNSMLRMKVAFLSQISEYYTLRCTIVVLRELFASKIRFKQHRKSI